MSRRRAVWLVARRELVERGRSRAFLLSVGITVAIILAAVLVPTLVAPGERTHRVGIAGAPPDGLELALPLVAAQANLAVVTERVADRAIGESRVAEGSLDALLVIPEGRAAQATYVVGERPSGLLQQLVAATLVQARITELMTEAGISQADLARVSQPPEVQRLQPVDEGRETAFLLANVGVILLFMSIFTFGMWVLTGVVEEKQSRVVEVVLSTVEPRDLLVGKVLGIGLLGLLQLTIMVTVGLSVAVVAGRLDLPATTPGAVVQLLLWFILGYTLYSTALAVLGALASRMEEASNASTPVTLLASGAYVFALLVAVDDPAGVPARVASLLPPVAPMVVPLRAALGAIEPWEILLSVALTLAMIAGLFVIGGRVYAGAVLRGGSRTKLRDAWRAAGE
jgi:ABC-2 type transport system permease protein